MEFIGKRAWSLEKLISRLCSRKTEILHRNRTPVQIQRDSPQQFSSSNSMYFCVISITSLQRLTEVFKEYVISTINFAFYGNIQTFQEASCQHKLQSLLRYIKTIFHQHQSSAKKSNSLKACIMPTWRSQQNLVK